MRAPGVVRAPKAPSERRGARPRKHTRNGYRCAGYAGSPRERSLARYCGFSRCLRRTIPTTIT